MNKNITKVLLSLLAVSSMSALATNDNITWVSPTELDLATAHNLCPLIEKKCDDKRWDLSTVKTFGDYTVAQSYPAGSGSYVSKMAYVDVGRQILTFEADEATGWLIYDVDGKKVQLIVDNNFISDSQLDENVMSLIKNAHKMSVVVDNKVFDVSTKGSGATMIYLNEFPRWVKQIK